MDLITNGFDDADFVGVIRKRTSKFTIRHIGMVDGLRDPRPFMQAAKALMVDDPAFASSVRIEFIGKVNKPYQDFVGADELLFEGHRLFTACFS